LREERKMEIIKSSYIETVDETGQICCPNSNEDSGLNMMRFGEGFL
jgi:hypothetical protein